MNQIEAFRLYDRDIPEFPFIVDKYKEYFIVYDKSDPFLDSKKNHLQALLEALTDLFNLPSQKIIIKQRKRKEDVEDQYTKLSDQQEYLIIKETQAQFYVNLHDYLDTGIFLDHRPMRQKIFKSSKDKRVLNLFCYTATISVFAALGGANSITSVDMSQTYIHWAIQNFKLNNLTCQDHFFVCENALDYLARSAANINLTSADPDSNQYDLIFLDPPTFSNSKRMSGNFEVERDQLFLVNSCMTLLKRNGVLYFSNNKRNFRLDEILNQKYFIKDISKDTIPQDFHDQKIHRCYEIRNK